MTKQVAKKPIDTVPGAPGNGKRMASNNTVHYANSLCKQTPKAKQQQQQKRHNRLFVSWTGYLLLVGGSGRVGLVTHRRRNPCFPSGYGRRSLVLRLRLLLAAADYL